MLLLRVANVSQSRFVVHSVDPNVFELANQSESCPLNHDLLLLRGQDPLELRLFARPCILDFVYPVVSSNLQPRNPSPQLPQLKKFNRQKRFSALVSGRVSWSMKKVPQSLSQF